MPWRCGRRAPVKLPSREPWLLGCLSSQRPPLALLQRLDNLADLLVDRADAPLDGVEPLEDLLICSGNLVAHFAHDHLTSGIGRRVRHGSFPLSRLFAIANSLPERTDGQPRYRPPRRP